MIELFTAATPNGWKASIALEELDIPYCVRPMNLSDGEHKTDWYLQINPNGKIPVIVDHDADDFVVFESGAILLYLAERCDRLLGANSKERSIAIQWLMFQMGGVGPMMGQAAAFLRYMPERIPLAIERYQREVQRLFGVLDRRLQSSEYLGSDYSIADIANWCWVHTYAFVDARVDPFPHLARWIAAIAARPAVQRGLAVPAPADLTHINSSELAARRALLT